AGRQSAQHIDRDLRIVGRAIDAEIRGKDALPLAAEEQIADHRNIADHRIERVGGNERAADIHLAGDAVDIAARIDADRAAIGAHVLQRYLAGGEIDIALDPVEGNALAAQQRTHAGERSEREEPRQSRRLDHAVIRALRVGNENPRAVAVFGGAGEGELAALDVRIDAEILEHRAEIIGRQQELPLARAAAIAQPRRRIARERGIDAGALPMRAVADELCRNRVRHAIGAQHQPVEPHIDIEWRLGLGFGRGAVERVEKARGIEALARGGDVPSAAGPAREAAAEIIVAADEAVDGEAAQASLGIELRRGFDVEPIAAEG